MKYLCCLIYPNGCPIHLTLVNHLPLQEPNDDLPENLVILARVVINGARSEVLGLGVDGSNLDGAEKRRL